MTIWLCICVLFILPFLSFHSFAPIYSIYFLLFSHLFKCLNNEHKDHWNSYPELDFERLSCIVETGFDKDIDDWTLSPEMMRLMDNEEKQILPHKEEIEVINLGNGEDKKKVKIGTLLSLSVKEEIIILLREYVDVFAWSYQDMLGLSTEIVEHRLPLKPEC